MGRQIIEGGLFMGALTLGLGYWFWVSGVASWQTLVFTALTLAQMANVLAIRSERESLFRIGLRSNMPLVGAVVLTVVLQLAVVYLPFLQGVFNTQALSIRELGLCAVVSVLVFGAVELEKFVRRRTQKDEEAV